MTDKKMRHCMAFYGHAGSTEGEYRRFYDFAQEVSEKMGKKLTHCGLSAEPSNPSFGKITSLRNLDNRIARAYRENRKIFDFSLFSLPKEWKFPYKENSFYIERTSDVYYSGINNCEYGYIVLESLDRISSEMLEYLKKEMPGHIDCVWGEEFMMENGRYSIGYCSHVFNKNPLGENLDTFFYDNLAITGKALIPLRRFRPDGTEVKFTGVPTLGSEK